MTPKQQSKELRYSPSPSPSRNPSPSFSPNQSLRRRRSSVSRSQGLQRGKNRGAHDRPVSLGIFLKDGVTGKEGPGALGVIGVGKG
jgi:hypothetical protein